MNDDWVIYTTYTCFVYIVYTWLIYAVYTYTKCGNPDSRINTSRINTNTPNWYKCTIEGCDRSFVQKRYFTRHLSNYHDIGKHKCGHCDRDKHSSSSYKCPILKITIKICRDCYRKKTGYAPRPETDMFEMLNSIHELLPYKLGHDKSLKSLGGCISRRPDAIYASYDLILIIECDERQHRGMKYRSDEKRMSDIYNETDFFGKRMIFIRWNPDTYKCIIGDKLPDRQARLTRLREVILDTIKTPGEGDILVKYMYFDKDNPVIAQDLEIEHID